MSPTITSQTESHPLQPFLPPNAKLLLLGSFPPPQARWCMDFFYPNFQNDMWRIMGQVFFGDTLHFVEPSPKHTFRYEAIVDFCRAKALLFTTPHSSSDGYKAMRPTSIWRLYSRLILRLYYVNFPRATTSVARVWKPQRRYRCGCNALSQKLARTSRPRSTLPMTQATLLTALPVRCVSGVCPPHRVPTRSPSTPKPLSTSKWWRKWGCCDGFWGE